MAARYSRRDLLKAAAYGGLSCAGSGLAGCRQLPGQISPRTPTVPDYKALVCVFLYGGNDGYNLLVPVTPEKYAPYARARQELAVPRDQLLPLAGAAADGANYGLHPSCAPLRDLYSSGHAALLANVGSLLYPIDKSGYGAGRAPPRLFSHEDQQDQWQTTHADASEYSGWAGRAADLLSGVNQGELPLNLAFSGANRLQAGARTSAFSVSANGAQQLDDLADDRAADATASSLRSVFDQLRRQPQAHAFGAAYGDVVERAIRLNALLDTALTDTAALTTPFPDTDLAAQLHMVARIISARRKLGMQRQIFFVSAGGFDTHDAQASQQPGLFSQLAQALKAFYDATAELGVAGAVTSFTASEFGRSLTVNGKGTDHGWSSHHCIVGGAVNGGRIYGQPPSLEADGADDSEGGRFIPSTAVDQYGATLLRWFGIGDNDLDTVFPNLRRFSGRDLGFLR